MILDRFRFVASTLIALLGAALTVVAFVNLFGLWIIGIVIVVAPILFVVSNRFFPDRAQSVEDAITRSTQLKKVSDKLDAHYQGVIDRIDQKWDYQPSDGEQIFLKGSPAQRPKGLEQDKKHLSYFENAWNLYSNGPVLYGEYRQAETQARNRILDDLISVEPALSSRLQEILPSMITDRIDHLFRTGLLSAPSFQARDGNVSGESMIFIDQQMLDIVGEHSWTLANARQLGSLMDKMVWHPEIVYVAVQKREALGKLSRNRSDFLSAKDEIARRAKSVDYHLSELRNSECEDCRLLKENQKSLLGGRGAATRIETVTDYAI